MDRPELEYAFTEPVRQFARKRGLSPATVYAWIDSGELETFLEGHRRHVVLASYDRMVRRRVAEQGSMKLPSSNPKVKGRQGASEEAGSQDASDRRLDSPMAPRHRNREVQRGREMTGIGRAAQDKLAPPTPAAGPREQSAKLQMCSGSSALRETDGGSDSTEALAADRGRNALDGGLSGGQANHAQPLDNAANQTKRRTAMVD